MSDAPSCPISIGQIAQASFRAQLAAYPKPAQIKNLVNQIPRAHDLPTVITAINRINNIVTIITRGEPQVNNTYVMGQPSVILKGDDFNPNYQRADWVLEGRVYERKKIKNPDDEEQYIEIHVLKSVNFTNVNEGTSLTYEQDPESE